MSGVELPEITQDFRRHLDANELYRIVKEGLDFFLRPQEDVDDILARDDVEDPDTGRTYKEKLRYELRCCQTYFSESGLVGQSSQRQFAGSIQYAIDQARKTLKMEQPGCEWTMIAAKVHRRDLTSSAETGYAGTRNEEGRLADWVMSKEPVAIERTIDYAQVPEYRCYVQMVWCDLSRGEIVDPAAMNPEGKEGPFTKYCRSHSMRHLTESQRQMRRECEDIVRSEHARMFGVLPRAQPEPDAGPAAVDPEEEVRIAEMRLKAAYARAGRQSEAYLLDPIVVPPPSVVLPEAPPLAEELRTQIYELRMGTPDRPAMTPRAISKHLQGRVTEEEVKAVLATFR